MERESRTVWCGILSGLGLLVVAGCEAPPSNGATESSVAGSGIQAVTLIEPTREMLANEYVPTPGGQRVHRSCVIEVESGGKAKQGRPCAYKPYQEKSVRSATAASAAGTPDPTISWAWCWRIAQESHSSWESSFSFTLFRSERRFEANERSERTCAAVTSGRFSTGRPRRI